MRKNDFVGAKTVKQEVILKSAIAVVSILLFSCATSVGALIRIPLPFTPVPITLQTYFVLLAGLTLGTVGGALSQILYLVYGILGLPIFASGHTGLDVLFAPTGGYLLGFIAAAFISGWAAKPNVTVIRQILYLVLASCIIYILGSVMLSLSLNCSLATAIQLGVLPFIPGDICKIAAVYGSWSWGKKLLA